MKIEQILSLPSFRVLSAGKAGREVSKIFCCDLLSIAMSRAPADCVWVTVMGNKNTLAVASLTETACIILAEGVVFDSDTLKKAEEEGIAVLATDLPVFDTALEIYQEGFA